MADKQQPPKAPDADKAVKPRIANAHEAFLPDDLRPLKDAKAEFLAAEKVAPSVKQYDEALAAVAKKHPAHFREVKSAHADVEAAKTKLATYVVKKDGKPVEVDGKPQIIKGKENLHSKAAGELKTAEAALAEKKGALKTFLTAGDKSSEEVKKFADASKEMGKFNGMFGNMKAQGAWAATKSNFTPSSPGNSGRAVFGRVAAVAAGAGLTVHAFQSKTADGQDRSWVTRTAEGALGVGLMAGGALMGKARF